MSYANKAALRTAVRSWLTEDNTAVLPDSVIDDAIEFVEEDLNFGTFGPRGKALRVLEMQLVKTAFILEDAEEYVSLPDNYIVMRYVYSTTSSAKQTLTYSTPEDFVNAPMTSGEVLLYTMSGGEIRVKPKLNTGDQLEMGYYGTIPALVNDTDSNWLLAKKHQIYLYGTLSHLGVYLSESQLNLWVAGYERAVLGMIKSDMRRQTGEGPLTYGMHEAVA